MKSLNPQSEEFQETATNLKGAFYKFIMKRLGELNNKHIIPVITEDGFENAPLSLLKSYVSAIADLNLEAT